jgi:hypothetical protein
MTAKESKGDMDVAKALLGLGEDGVKEKAPSSDSDSETESEEEILLGDEYKVMLRKLKF